MTAVKNKSGPGTGCPPDRPVRQFDGIVCFGGEDWWYHNRGHYDMQMMRQLATWMPVLYVNSLGMRTPNPGEGRMFFTRVGRKLQSIRRGLVRVSDGLAVFSPLLLPSRFGIVLTRPLLTQAVRSAARREGITRPLVWAACPTAAEAVDALDPAAVVYQRTDRYECFHGVDAHRIADYDGWLKARADLTIFCSTMLFEQEAEACRSACYVDHGVDFERFISAADGEAADTNDLAGLGRPRVGFVGGIDAHTFDPDLFLEVARLLPEAQFLLVGACSLPLGWCDLPNVSLLGQRPFESIPGYMAACDVLIMPWNRSPWIEACNPVKLKEYLAVGRPVVSTDFPELRRYDGLVRTAACTEEFAEAIRAALREPGDPRRGRDRVRKESWSSKSRLVLDELDAKGIVPGHLSQRPAPHRRKHPTSAWPAAAPAEPVVVMALPGPGEITTPAPKEIERQRLATREANLDSGKGDSSEMQKAPDAHPHPIDLAACILLAGGLRPSPLVAATGRSVLDLWLTPDRTVLESWTDRIAELAAMMSQALPIRVVHDSILPAPWPSARPSRDLIIEQEPKALRGPAGVVRDLCRAYAPDQHVLVAEAARYLGTPLWPMLAEHSEHDADITVASNAGRTPAGIYLIRCGALDLAPAVGFMDLKEQWLPRAVDAGLNVRVCQLPDPGARPLRTRRQFLAAARIANRSGFATPVGTGPAGALLPAGQPSGLRVVCAGGLIGPGATLVDSIVMPGANVGPDAVVVRSLLCPNARVQAGSDIVDAVVSEGRELSDLRLAKGPRRKSPAAPTICPRGSQSGAGQQHQTFDRIIASDRRDFRPRATGRGRS
ncbi:MAG: glycosyltransferase [Planctomycetota bacterium]